MKTIYVPLLLAVCAASALAQEGGNGKVLLAYQRTNTSMEMESAAPHARGVGGTISQSSTLHYPTMNTCLTVYEGGNYQFEKVDERGSKPKTKIYQGTLTPEQLQQLQAIVNEESLKGLSSPPLPEVPSDAGRLKEGELVTVKIARDSGPQDLAFAKKRYSTTGGNNLSSGLDSYASNWGKNDKPMKPVLSWVKDVEKKSQSVAKDGTATSCVSPEGAF